MTTTSALQNTNQEGKKAIMILVDVDHARQAVI